MAKKNSFDFGNYFDQDAISMLMDNKDVNAPSKDEVELIEKTEGDIVELPLSSLHDYHNHTYRVLDNEDMDALVDSIRDMGIILPLLVRKIDDNNYEVISGHRRKHAAAILNLEKVPCKITDVDDNTADIMMVDTNLHREEISPSEKARSYDVRIKAMKAMGMLPNNDDGMRKYEEELAKEIKSSRANIFRYRKLLDLEPELLEKIDNKSISVNAGAKLAGIPKDQQKIILEALEETDKPLTMDIADKLSKASGNDNGLTKEKTVGIFNGDFKPRSKKKPATIKKAEVKEKDFADALPKSITDLDVKDRAAFIKECITEYVSNHSVWKETPIERGTDS